MKKNELGTLILDCAFDVHRALGPGLLENTYKKCLVQELLISGLKVSVEHPVPVFYKGVKLDIGYRIDIFVEGLVPLEIKSVEGLNNTHLAQIMTYLKLSNTKLGYLLNFNEALLKNGVRRVVMG